jgi:signal transduction histidine kinase
VLASSQARSRREAQQGFLAQATTAAALTKAILSAVGAPQAQVASRTFGSATVDQRALARLVKSSHIAYAFITGSRGGVLASSTGTPAAALGSSVRPSAAVRRALSGQPWLSDLFQDPRGGFVTQQAIPFPTRFGQRVEVLGYPVTLLSGFLSSYLVGALPNPSAQAFVLDANDRLIGASQAALRIGQRMGNAEFSRALASGQGAYAAKGGGAGYLVSAPIGGSQWRVAIAEPTSMLYPAVVGSQAWVMWAVFAAFAIASMIGIYLLRRSLNAAAQIVEQADDVKRVNVALRSANAELDAFSYSVSHDLRAPLRAIDGFSSIVVDDDEGGLSDSQRRYLGLVRENTRAMGDLIDDLLAFSRLANQPITRRQVATAELVAELERELSAGENGRQIEFSNGELPKVDADPVLLRLVFLNLLENAVKYTREREPAQVVVDSENRSGELTFVVRDNGAGFDMRYSEKLFQVFQRLHRAEDYSGTGVGLAIVHRIVTRHGGRVWADAELGAGATFYFTLGGEA